jgi:arylsulfatase A-like enzyme
VPQGVNDTEHLASGVDIPATICDYAGVPQLPKTTRSRSWRPLFEGESSDWRDYVVGETSMGGTVTAIRDPRYKTLFRDNGEPETYDMVDDPLETEDLTGSAAGRRIQKRHHGMFKDYLDDIEIYRPPDMSKIGKKDRQRYRAYIKWYEEIKQS